MVIRHDVGCCFENDSLRHAVDHLKSRAVGQGLKAVVNWSITLFKKGQLSRLDPFEFLAIPAQMPTEEISVTTRGHGCRHG